MTRRGVLASVLIMALAFPVAGPARTEPVVRYTMANGMRVLVREDPDAGVVAVSLQVRAGSGLEGPATAGTTNFLHRAMLRGAAGRSAEQLVEAAELIGGSLDGSGDVEYAEVRGTALARYWGTLLGLVADVALAPTLHPDEVSKERRLILSQLRTRSDAPFPFTYDAILEGLYGSHPYAWPALGRPDVVGRVTADELIAHHRAIYRPDTLVLAVSGRIQRDEVRRAAERLFGKLSPSPSAPPALPSPPVASGARRVLERPAQQAQIMVGFLAPGLSEVDHPAARVLGALMGGGMAGRLFLELRESRGLAYSVGVLSPSRVGAAPFVAYLGTARENTTAAEEGMLRELTRVRVDGVSAAELDRAKAYVLGAQAMDRRTNARHAWYLAFFEVVGAGWDFPERYARAVEAVTAADVRAVAERVLSQPTVVVLQPR
ncbi:MAG: M16 family metallopeptidase [Candidatus Rokuibacteriota bacterium]